MKKKNIKIAIVVLIILAVALFFIAGTYSRYTSSLSAAGAGTVAKWAVAFKQGSTTLTNTANLTFTVNSNENVVAGKIAPGSTATATLQLDLTGTEVAVDYSASIDTTALATVFGGSADSVKVTPAASIGETLVSGTKIALPNGEAFTSTNGIVNITITVEWEDKNTAEANTSDTTVGTAGSTFTIPVTFTVQQHIGT